MAHVASNNIFNINILVLEKAHTSSQEWTVGLIRQKALIKMSNE